MVLRRGGGSGMVLWGRRNVRVYKVDGVFSIDNIGRL